MEIKMNLEYRGYEEREYNVNGNRGVTRLAVFLDDTSLQPMKLSVRDDYAPAFLALNLEERKVYTVVCDMTVQPQITNDRESYGRDRFVISQRNFLCAFVVKEVVPFVVEPVPVNTHSEAAASSDGKKVVK